MSVQTFEARLIKRLETFDFDALTAYDAVIDVRSPLEFQEDHIPGAISTPVLNNEERARVGYTYKQISKFEAKRLGAALISANIAHHLQADLRDVAAGWRPLVYCWRGGQRSSAMATILSEIGWPTTILDGGYKTYRRTIVDTLYDDGMTRPAVVLDGGTGTAKTAILRALARNGHAAIDLEAIAAHRGSLFGDWPNVNQPSQKSFESQLAKSLHAAGDRPIIFEAESSRIGGLTLPPVIWRSLETAPVIRISAPVEARAKHLITAYPDLTGAPERLEGQIKRLSVYHSKERVSDWRDLATSGRFLDLAMDLIRHHYDPAYARHHRRRPKHVMTEVALPSLDEKHIAIAVERISNVLASHDA